MAKITHNVFFDGKVQSLGLKMGGESGPSIMSLGVALQGKYDFGIATRREKIICLSGDLCVNGKNSLGEWIEIKMGDKVVLECSVVSTYRCDFPE